MAHSVNKKRLDMKTTLYHVSYMMYAQDNGHCVTFQTKAQQERLLEELAKEHAWHVSPWETVTTLMIA